MTEPALSAAGLADSLVKQFRKTTDFDELIDECALYTGMDWQHVRDGLLDALGCEVEAMLREAEER